MALAAVETLQQNLKQLLLHHPNLISGAKEHVEVLENRMRFFRTFLRDGGPDVATEERMTLIRKKVHEIEDVLDPLVSKNAYAAQSKASFFRKLASNPGATQAPSDLSAVAEDIKTLVEDLNHSIDHPDVPPTMAQHKIQEVPMVREDKAEGFEDAKEMLINCLMEETDNLDMIAIVGMPGQGKTTLARKIFNDSRIVNKFQPRIWVNVSEDYRREDAFNSISEKFPGVDTQEHEETVQKVRRQLDQLNFLIVLDDVWRAEAWDDLRVAFPIANQRGKILITSPNMEVTHWANMDRPAYKLRLLTDEECWSILQSMVFQKTECPPQLQPIGKSIAQKCGGIPLAVNMIGGILSKNAQSKDEWTKISGTLDSYLQENLFSLSYNNLPDHLKPCFLYLGMFPKGFEIPVWRLVQLWIAEGFIPQKEETTMEQIAHDYLVDLINRNLVMAEKMSIGGRNVKTCGIHHALHDFCKTMSGPAKGNFYREIKGSSEEGFEAIHDNDRRICIHSWPMGFISSQPVGQRVRTFLCFSEAQEQPLPDEHASSIPAAFKLLRVLDARPITLMKFPRGSTKMVHLRYIVLTGNFKVLPEAISELWNLQTLVVYTSSSRLAIKANIWRMIQMRHVKTNKPATLPMPQDNKESESLQTLGMVSVQSCTEEVFDAACNLTALAVCGSLSKLFNANVLDMLWKLEKLKLVNDTSELQRLPYNFPPNLRKLTLSATKLDWSHMSKLGMLETLEILKLKEKAFMGSDWNSTEVGFPCLQVLHIESTNLIRWHDEAVRFPSLKCLVIRDCKELEEVPSRLGEIESFTQMELEQFNDKVNDSARKIEEAKEQLEQDEYGSSSNRNKFQLKLVKK